MGLQRLIHRQADVTLKTHFFWIHHSIYTIPPSGEHVARNIVLCNKTYCIWSSEIDPRQTQKKTLLYSAARATCRWLSVCLINFHCDTLKSPSNLTIVYSQRDIGDRLIQLYVRVVPQQRANGVSVLVLVRSTAINASVNNTIALQSRVWRHVDREIGDT